jgi:DNA polymerase-3 subunit delta'
MLDEYKDSQKTVYKILKNAIINDRVSHAYLFETNGYIDSKKVAISFAKALFCPNKFTNFTNCNGCHQCHNIDDGNFVEIKIIEPDGMWIKKEQLDELQKEFSMKSVVSNKKIYIINQVDKLNISSANTILKFLEEPSENIIAILLTDNLYQVIPTILSRCQVISFKKESININNNLSELAYYIKIPEILDTKEKVEEILEIIKKFIKYVETNGKDTILFTNRMWHENIIGKEMNIFALEIMIYIYRDMLTRKMNRDTILIDVDYLDTLPSNTILQINRKLKILLQTKDDIKYNANIQLLIDKLIIELSD